MLEFDSPSEADQAPLEFTPDRVADIRAAVKNIQQNLAMIPWLFDNEGVSRFAAQSVVGLAESEIARLGKLLDVETEAAEKIEKRHADIRRANLRIRELEELLGQNQAPQAIQPALKNLSRQLHAWWELEGFGHISELAFGEYNLRVRFSCQMMGAKPHIPTPEPLPRKERFKLWLAALQERGFLLLEEDGDKGVRDCPESRQALAELFRRRLSSAAVSQFVSREGRSGSQLVAVEVYIRDITQVLDLPVPPPDAEDID